MKGDVPVFSRLSGTRYGKTDFSLLTLELSFQLKTSSRIICYQDGNNATHAGCASHLFAKINEVNHGSVVQRESRVAETTIQ